MKHKIGDRVRIKGYTKDGLTYGYIRDIFIVARVYEVYFPETQKFGMGWTDADFTN